MREQISKESIKKLPDLAGIYQYIGEDGKILYIGKANSLKKRVKSYWRFTPTLHPNPNLSARVQKMLQESFMLEYILVDTPTDALILENTLIKRFKPKYNILLRDDRSYPYISINLEEDFPRFELTRELKKRKNLKYWGPFPTGAKSLLGAIYQLFPIVQKRGLKRQKEACLFFQIGRCLAPCEGKVSKEEYQKVVEDAISAIESRQILIKKLTQKMERVSSEFRFGEAIKLREQIKSIKSLQLNSSLEIPKSEDLDIFAIAFNSLSGVVVKMFVRGGKVISSSSSSFRVKEGFDLEDAYRQAIISFYSKEPITSSVVLTPKKLEDSRDIEEFLTTLAKKRVKLLKPQRGFKAKLVEIAVKNAKEALKLDSLNSGAVEVEVAKSMRLKNIPNRVEIFDNSHLAQELAVGAMVVWSSGKWEKNSYRRYNLESKDEYSQMRELLTKRASSFSKNPPPDLWIIDGGETLRLLAKEILKEFEVDIDVVAISKAKTNGIVKRAKSKAEDKIYSDSGLFEFESRSRVLLWLQRLRDNAHRFAINYQRKKREKEAFELSLLKIDGVGKGTILKLIDYFGSFEAISKASLEELEVVVGAKIAKIIYQDSTNIEKVGKNRG